jgi:FKBP-type peptidyl-prolyl cis-trans isomerase
MKHRTIITAIMTAGLILSSCAKEKLEDTYNKQEDRIDQFIEKNRYQKRNTQVPKRDPETGRILTDENGQPVMKDTVVTDTLRVIYNGGAARLVTKEGEGEEVRENGSIAFYYAGYTFSGSISASNLFTTNHKETAASAGWNLTDEQDDILTISLNDYKLLPGLKSGLIGARGGEECQILFSGKYGFGKKSSGIVPANSALVYKIWVESVSND